MIKTMAKSHCKKNILVSLKVFPPRPSKLGCVVKMVVDSILPHAGCGLDDHWKDVPLFTKKEPHFDLLPKFGTDPFDNADSEHVKFMK